MGLSQPVSDDRSGLVLCCCRVRYWRAITSAIHFPAPRSLPCRPAAGSETMEICESFAPRPAASRQIPQARLSRAQRHSVAEKYPRRRRRERAAVGNPDKSPEHRGCQRAFGGAFTRSQSRLFSSRRQGHVFTDPYLRRAADARLGIHQPLQTLPRSGHRPVPDWATHPSAT